MKQEFFGCAGNLPADALQLLQAGQESGPKLAPDHSSGASWTCFATGRQTTLEALTVVAAGSPRWAGCDLGLASSASVPALVASAWRQMGPKLLDHLHGDFGLVVIDRQTRRVMLAVDRMGIQRLAYALAGQAIVFGSSAERVARFAGVRGDLRRQGLFDYLLLHMVPAPQTVFEGVAKLRPGTKAEFTDGKVTTSRYWQPRFVEARPANPVNLESELLSSLENAVRACDPGPDSGAFLSGGLDSSSVAGMLSRASQGAARTFSIGFKAEGYNEIEYARIAAKHFNLASTEYDLTPKDIVAAFPKIAAAYDEPFGNSSAVPTYWCARVAAEHGVTHLLAGDGGDEIFGGNERYARQPVFERYQRIPGFLRRGLIEPLLAPIDTERAPLPLRKLASYVSQARIPLPERLEAWNHIYRIDLSTMLEPEFHRSVDTRAPFRGMQEVYDGVPGASLLNHMLFYDWHYTLADNDLRKVSTMCELAGVRVSYPMLDQRMIDLSLRVPSKVKMRGNALRSFYKDAMADFLPREILQKPKHGFGLPFGVWLKTDAALRDLIFSLTSDLKRRRIVRASFLDRLINEHSTGAASYYGYAIWDLAMLEAWLAAHSSSA